MSIHTRVCISTKGNQLNVILVITHIQLVIFQCAYVEKKRVCGVQKRVYVTNMRENQMTNQA